MLFTCYIRSFDTNSDSKQNLLLNCSSIKEEQLVISVPLTDNLPKKDQVLWGYDCTYTLYKRGKFSYNLQMEVYFGASDVRLSTRQFIQLFDKQVGFRKIIFAT